MNPEFQTQDSIFWHTTKNWGYLIFLIQGMKSKEIGTTLGLSKETIDRHLKNMLIRTPSKSTHAVTARAVQEGWF